MAKAAAFRSCPADSTMLVLTHVSGWFLLWLVPLLHLEIPGAGAQEFFQLLQPQDALSVPAGGTVTLTCSVSGAVPVGPVKWFKGSGSGRQLVYADKGLFPRVSRAVPDSDTDFTIRIRDTRPEDSGTYRCVKFKTVTGGEEQFRSGAGTDVSVSCQSEFASPGLWIGLCLGKVLTAAFLLFLFLFLRSKG